MATPNEQTPAADVIKKTFELLKSGEELIELQDQCRKIVLVIGDTGNGKTTLTKWIAGDYEHLLGKETVEDSGDYIIEDLLKENNLTLVSDTVFPTLFVDTESNVAYYDCPGFNDTRGTSRDIASTYFIKRVVDYAISIKILLVINYPSVRKGGDRHNFMQLLKNATKFIKNVKKFRDSIALVVTKVDNTYQRGGTVLVEDFKVIAVVAKFLEEVKEHIESKFPGAASTEMQFLESASKLVSYLLKNNGEQYEKIGIFRRPDESGFLHQIQLLQKGKKFLKKTINENLKFTDKIEADFGYTISLKSQNDIGCLVEEINSIVWRSLSRISDKIEENYTTLINVVRKTVKSFNNSDRILDADHLHSEKMYAYLKQGCEMISNYTKDFERVTSPSLLFEKIDRFLVDTEIAECESDVSTIQTQGSYFDFLQVVSEQTLNTRPWEELFRRLKSSTFQNWNELQKDIEEAAPIIQRNILYCFECISKDLQKQAYENIKELEIDEISKRLNHYGNCMSSLVERVKKARGMKEFLKIIRDSMLSISINLPNDTALKLIKLDACLGICQNFKENDRDKILPEWTRPFESLMNHLKESENFYIFLHSLYRTFTEYRIQMDKEKFNVADIEDWGKTDVDQGIAITENNLDQFLENISGWDIAKLETIKNATISDARMEEINEVLNLTLKSQTKIKNENQNVSVLFKGDCIKLSEIRRNPEISGMNFNFLCIFALRTVFVDEDLTLPGRCVVIVAPKWEVIGERKIDLDGLEGEPHSIRKAKDASDDQKDGEDGKPGLPGNPGGYFLGIGQTFIDGSNLTITANGGNGARGQDGGDGRKLEVGWEGKIPDFDFTFEEISNGIKDVKGLPCKHIVKPDNYFEVFGFRIYDRLSSATYKICEGDGGSGGKGGEGGNPGVVVLYELDGSSGISKGFRKGESGENGRAGEGGNEIIAKGKFFNPWFIERLFGGEDKTELFYVKTEEGKENRNTGVSNFFRSNFIQGFFGDEESIPVEAVPGNDVSTIDVSGEIDEQSGYSITEEAYQFVNNYKCFVLENLNCQFKRSALLEFFYRLNSSKIKYNAVGFIEEFIGIEEQCARSHLKDSNIIPIYQSMLCRIYKCEELIQTKENKAPLELLKYLYSAILSKIYVSSDISKTNLVIDIGKNLDMIKKDIENLKELQTGECNSILTNKHTKGFNDNVNEKIEEAKRLILQVLPEIVKMGKKVDEDMHSLVEEIIRLQEDAQSEKNCLILKRQELVQSLSIKYVFNIFELVSKTIISLCNAGVSVNLIKTAASNLEILALKMKKTSNTATAIISILDLFDVGTLDNIEKESLNFLSKFVGFLSKAIDSYPQYLQDLSPMIKQIEEDLAKYQDEKKPSLMKMKEIRMSLKKALINKIQTLQTQEARGELEDALKLTNVFNTLLEMVSFKAGFENNQTKTAELLKLSVSDCLANIERMKMNIEAEGTLVMGNEKYLHHSDFSSQNVGTVPFFTWKKETHGNLISRLLSGEEIILKADVKESPVNKDGIKFNFVEFQFRCRNESLQSRLDRLLKGFDLKATHMGNSYYRYENRIYLIPSDKLTFSYSYEKHENGENIPKNDVYDKVRRGNVMLSPYTAWHLKLTSADNRSSFEEFKAFNDDVDLELAGHGSYIMNFKDLNLEAEHCRVVEVIDELDQFLN